MESLVTELVWLVTNCQAWVVGVLLFGDPHVWYRRYSFFEILAPRPAERDRAMNTNLQRHIDQVHRLRRQ